MIVPAPAERVLLSHLVNKRQAWERNRFRIATMKSRANWLHRHGPTLKISKLQKFRCWLVKCWSPLPSCTNMHLSILHKCACIILERGPHFVSPYIRLAMCLYPSSRIPALHEEDPRCNSRHFQLWLGFKRPICQGQGRGCLLIQDSSS